MFNTLALLGHTNPTPIQSKAIPLLADGRSVIGLAPTGSGKTIAFLLPLLKKIDPTFKGTQILVLVPTRELGEQVRKVAQELCAALDESFRGVLVRTAFGGQKISAQLEELEKRPQVLVATPGRLIDHLKRETVTLKDLQALVLDEADHMVGLGFFDQISNILDEISPAVQTALFSATLSERVAELGSRFHSRAVTVDVREESPASAAMASTFKSSAHAPVAASKFRQEYIVGEGPGKHTTLQTVLSSLRGDITQAIIFCQMRETVHTITEFLKNVGLAAEGLAGDLGQIQRSTLMRRFKSGGFQFLVATNVAARGIDIPAVNLVVNYDLPDGFADYVHRMGRSGRAEEPGWVLTFCTSKQLPELQDWIRQTGGKPQARTAAKSPSPTETSAIPPASSPVQFVKLHLNRGKSDKVRPGDILGTLTQALGLHKDEVGSIFIFDHFSHVEVAQSKLELVKAGLAKTKIKNLNVKASESTSD